MIEKILSELQALKADAVDKWDGGASYRAYTKAIEIVQEVAKEYGNKWIPCSERLPKNHERILCLHSSGFIDCGDFICESWCCDMDEYSIKKDKVIAWQPLPAPYQKGE